MRLHDLAAWHDPHGITLTHGLFEVVVVAAALVTLIHAIVGARSGDKLGWVLWFAGLIVGLLGDPLLRAMPGSYAPGAFTVSLFGGAGSLATALRLPFGVYLAGRAVDRGGYGPLSSALVAGLILALLNLPAQAVANAADLWRWSGHGSLFGEDWLGAPLAASLVQLAVGAGVVGVARAMAGPISGPWWRGLLFGPLAAAGGMLVAGLILLVLTGLAMAGLSPLALTVGSLGLAGTCLVRGRGGAGQDKALLAIPLIYVGACLGIAARVWGVHSGGETLTVAGLVALNISLHLGLNGGAVGGGGRASGKGAGR